MRNVSLELGNRIFAISRIVHHTKVLPIKYLFGVRMEYSEIGIQCGAIEMESAFIAKRNMICIQKGCNDRF